MSTIFRSKTEGNFKIIVPKSFNGYTITKELGKGSFALIERDEQRN